MKNSYFKIFALFSALKPLFKHGHDLSRNKVIEQSEALVTLLQEMGPTYVKLGQILSVRFDLLPREACFALQKLLDSEKPVPYPLIHQVLTEELGYKLSHEISRIEPEPIGVASLGQVHKAYLKNGDVVAIKVQKPGAKEQVHADLKTINRALKLISWLPVVKKLSLISSVNEFERWILSELDYYLEAANTEGFRDTYKDYTAVRIPRVYKGLSTDKVLVTEYISGITIKQALQEIARTGSETVKVKNTHIPIRKVIDIMKESLFRQLFHEGLLHGDPHPSNFIICNQNLVSYIDFGIVTRINKTHQQTFKDLLFALAGNDIDQIIRIFISLDQEPGSESGEEIQKKLKPLFEKFSSSISKEYSPTQFFLDMTYVIGRAGVQPPVFFILLGKVLATYDGMLQAVDSKANFLDELLPLFEREIADETLPNLSPEKLKEKGFEAFKTVNDLVTTLTELPKESLEILQEIKTNGIKVNYSDDQHNHPHASHEGLAVLFFYAAMSLFAFVYSLGPNITYSINGISIQLILLTNWGIVLVVSVIYLLKKKIK